MLYFVTEMKLFISIVLVLNMFLKKLNNVLTINRLQANDSIMYGYFCVAFIDFILAGKKLSDFTNLFSPYDLKKNDDIILSYFKNE